MQDRYAGDLGDYLKFGLLRWLAPPGAPTSSWLGVVYLTERLAALPLSPWATELRVYWS